MKTILVPIDFSEYSKQALNFSIEFNEHMKGKIILLHVFSAPIVKDDLLDTTTKDDLKIFFQEKLVNQVKKKLEEWGSILDEKGINHDKRLLYGNPYDQITQQIIHEEADLIVMGSRGASGLKEIFVGSNAERVIRFASCPVIVVKGETHVNEIRNITFATDGSKEVDTIVDQVKWIQKLLKMKIHLLKIRTLEFETEEENHETLHRFAQRNGISNYTINSFQASLPDVGIIEFARQIHSGLIIVATHGNKGLKHIIGGSWSENVVNESKIPVLSFNLSTDSP